MKKPIILLLVAGFLMSSCLSFAQDPKVVQELSRQIMAAKDNKEAFVLFQKAKDVFVKDAKFNEFALFLKEIAGKKKSFEPLGNYFLGLDRYLQLKHLEEKQDWNEYFDKGNDYRQELILSLSSAIKVLSNREPANLYSVLLLWQFHYDQQDAFAEKSLEELLAGVKSYSESAEDAAVIKEIADKLQSYEQKAKAKEIYGIFIDKMMKTNPEEKLLKEMAAGFFGAGNIELAETVYDAYFEKIAKAGSKEKVVAELSAVARDFSYKDGSFCDPVYAEKLFEKIEGLYGKSSFDEQLTYLRAYNLEKAKEYQKAKDAYIVLLDRFPGSSYYDKVNFKLGIISAYALRDLKLGREYFQKLAGKEIVSPEVICSLYQLGLWAQWEEDLERAKANYLKLKEKAGSGFKSSVDMAEERLKEISENKLLDSNIRGFLDVSLKEEHSVFNMSKLDLKSSVYNLKKDQEFTVTATAYPPESGCMQVSLEYNWVGEFGKTAPTSENSNFTSSYPESGTKFIGLVVRTSGGVIDRAIDLIDVE